MRGLGPGLDSLSRGRSRFDGVSMVTMGPVQLSDDRCFLFLNRVTSLIRTNTDLHRGGQQAKHSTHARLHPVTPMARRVRH